ncbi:hypothetical protein TGAM01_v208764 [Trichoderma gamsii]|uniref:NACHT domain-containing protein n=1 Tax=Trichoderma gamsii TaxID=398673 RepID=A0A2P4ZDE4_9HYPO|nr:hypothetical protein TGAM01_v208764 [Trichoderma gamsii]PON22281.1 hypothetical protein TGAM01_v208764 [Trichoderma gamsii]
MGQSNSKTRDVSNNQFGNNVTITQGDVHNHASDQENQCLKDLRSTDPRDDKLRIQNTKGGLLIDSYRWILENKNFKDWRDNAQNRILWIKGDPGKGKTMLLCGIIDELTPTTKLAKPTEPTTNTVLLSYFFCQGTDARINNATAVLRGLIYLLVVQEPSLMSHVQARYKHAGKDLFSDANAWVALSEILIAILQDSKAKEVILVIDALDECETDLPMLLEAIVQQLAPLHVKCILSSRNVIGIQQRLESYIPQGILSLELKENASCVSEAVDAYINHSVSRLNSVRNDQGRQDELRNKIQEKAQGTFLWASLVMKKIEEVQVWEIMKVVEKMPMGLTALYKRMIDHIHSLEEENGHLCRNMLSTIFTAYFPLSLAELGVLAGLPDQISGISESIKTLVTMCGSFVTLNEGYVYFIHQSAKDYLAKEMYSTDAAQRHLDVFERSVAAISKLPKNIYGLTDFGPRPENAQPPDPNPLASMRYSCFYWANHLCDTCAANTKNEAQVIITETLEPFLESYFLRWIESLSLFDGLPEGLRFIRKLLLELPHGENTQFARFLSTIESFILRNGALIAKSPLQVYGSALIFSPLHDHAKSIPWNERLSFIEDIQGIRKSAFLQMLKSHTGIVRNLAFSRNSAMLASKALNGDLRCWDVATGALKCIIPCYDVGQSAIAFSPDNRMLLLATEGDPMEERNIELLHEQLEKEGAKGFDHLGYWITYITLSLDDGMPEASHSSRIVRLEKPALSYQDYEDIIVFAFSSDCKTLASGWRYGSINLWDTTTGLLRQTIQGHEDRIEAIAVSPDGSKIASGCASKLRLWDAATGDLLKEFEWLGGNIEFFQDGLRFQSGRHLYDLTTGIVMQTSMIIDETIIAISPDNKILASASYKEVQLWDATMSIQEKDKSDEFGVHDVFALSLDGNTVAYAKANTIQIWDTATGECRRIIEDYWPDIIAQQEVTILPNAKKNDRRFEYTAIEFAADAKILALGSASCLKTMEYLPLDPPSQIQLWDLVAGECTYRKTLRRGLTKVRKLAFSPDGNRLAVGFDAQRLMLLDIAADMCLWEAVPHVYPGPKSFAFFPNDNMLASAHPVYRRDQAHNHEIELWDIATGKHLQNFKANVPEGETCSSPVFLPDGRFFHMDRWGKMRLFQADEKPLSPDANLSNGLQVQRIPFNEGWIKKDGRSLFFIPEDHRAFNTFVCGNTIVLGHRSGLTFIWLNL